MQGVAGGRRWGGADENLLTAGRPFDSIIGMARGESSEFSNA